MRALSTTLVACLCYLIAGCGGPEATIGHERDPLAIAGTTTVPTMPMGELPPPPPPPPPPEPGLLAHYKLDGNAADVGPYGLHGSTWFISPDVDRNGVAGGAVRFSGYTQYYSQVRLDYDAPFDFAGDFTISVFVRVDGLPPHICPHDNRGEAFLVGKPPYANYQLSLRHYGGSSYLVPRFMVATHPKGIVSSVEAPAAGITTSSGYHHLAARRSGNTISLFVDGKLHAIKGGVAQAWVNDAVVWIGAPPPSLMTNDAGYMPFEGAMDELRFYRRALTDVEIFKLSGKLTNLVAK
jgi:hypothetical protein